MKYYRRYVGDYMRDTAHLSVTEHGIYTLLLDHQYATEKPLPVEIPALARLCRATGDTERAAVRSIASAFFPIVGGGRWNPRARRDVALTQTVIEKQRESGTIAARKRWASDRSTDGSTDRSTHRSTGRSAMQSPITNHQSPITNHQPPAASASPSASGLHRSEARASRLPAAWQLPDEWREWAINEKHWTPEHAQAVADHFHDYWIARAGKDGRKLDWFATWRNWCRNETRASKGNGQASRQQSLETRNAEAARQFAQEGKK